MGLFDSIFGKKERYLKEPLLSKLATENDSMTAELREEVATIERLNFLCF